MGICMYAQTADDNKIKKVLSNPPLIWLFVAPDNPNVYLEETGQLKPPGLLSRLFGKKREWPPRIPQFEFAENERHEVDLDKAWDGINFCLKNIVQRGECKNLFEDGKPAGRIEIGYGPGLCFTSEEVAKIARQYCSISEDDLIAQYTPSNMTDVYPKALWSQDDDECREYLSENFASLKEFLAHAEKYKLGVIVQYS